MTSGKKRFRLSAPSFLAMLLALTLLVLAGCSSNSASTSTPSQNQQQSQAPSGSNSQEQKPKDEPVDFPTKPVHIVTTHPAGSTIDTPVRFIEPILREELGVPIVIDNMDGAGGNLARSHVWKQPPDGYTLLMTYVPSIDIGPIVSPDVDFVPLEFTHVFNIVGGEGYSPVLFVGADSPHQTLKDLVEAAKANPDSILVGHSGFSTAAAAAVRLLESETGIQLRHVPFDKAADATTAAISGQIHVAVQGNPATSLPLVEQGQAKPIAVLGPDRDPLYPDTPTAAEAGYENVEMNQLIGLYAPPNTPRPIVDILAKAIEKSAADPDFLQRMKDYGAPVWPLGPDEFAEVHKGLAASIEKIKESLIPESQKK